MAIHALSNVAHRQLRFQNLADPYTFVKDKVLATLVISELGHVLRHMPIVFGLNDGKASLVGLMGLSENENLFINQRGTWQGGYIPAVLRSVPFGLAPGETPESPIVVINLDAGHFSESHGIRLFDDEGNVSDFLTGMLNFLNAYKENEVATALALTSIVAAEILIPWELNITTPDGQPRLIAGLFQIDMPKFNALGADTLASLHATGALGLIYAHQHSLQNVSTLEKMAREKEPVIPSTIEFDLLKEDYLRF